MIDWLRTDDLGVVADALGQPFDEIIELLLGANRKERVNSLWQRARAFYREVRPPSELQALTPEMVKAPGQPAKLRAKAAQCRYLLPFGAALAKEFSGGSEHRATVSNLMQYLLEVTMCMSTEPYDASRAATACRRFCLLYSALEKEALQNNNLSSWRCKPKLHLFQELIEYTSPEAGSPSLFWTYLDESWGGWLAHTGARRGGANRAPTTALNLLRRFRACVKEHL
jgi:hypothetical protein